MRNLKVWFFFILLFFSNFLLAFEGVATHRQGSGIGYKKQYSKIGIYHAFENHALQPFIDLRYLVLNKGKQGANLGAGLAYQFAQENRLSAYTYFDLAESRTNHIFNQVTGGLSYTHPLIFSDKDWGELTYYFNGYFPLKSIEKKIKSSSFAGFKGNHLLINQTDRYALTGTNLEIGYLSCSWSNWNAYIAGSAYYFKRSELHGFGGFGKVRVIYNDLISIEGLISGDRLFGTNISGTLGIRIPLGKREMKSVKNRHYCVHKSRPIERLEPIVLDKNRRKEVAKDASGVPLNFIFVNNLNGSNGTFEDPFATLLDAQNSSNPGDVVYVFPGDGTTKGMNAGITMQERQTLAGSGTALAVVTSRGNIIVPALTAQGPQITNTAGNGVDIARNCTVSGITVSGASSNGFSYLSNNGVSTINMLHCTSNNSGRQGFDFISGGSSQVSFAFDNCVSAGATRNGLRFISNDTSQMNLVSNHCTASNAGIDNFGIASNDASQMNLTFNHCDSIDGSGDGFFLDSDHESQINVVFNHCIVAGVSGDGFDAQSDDISQMNLTFNNCRSSTSAQEGFEIDSRASSKMTVIFNQCSSNGAAFDGFDVRSANTSRMSASLNNCIATNSGPSSGGFEFDAANTSLMTLKMSGCSATNNDDIGYRIGVFGSNITGSLTQCSSVENANANFSIATPIAGTFTITGNTTLSTEL